MTPEQAAASLKTLAETAIASNLRAQLTPEQRADVLLASGMLGNLGNVQKQLADTQNEHKQVQAQVQTLTGQLAEANQKLAEAQGEQIQPKPGAQTNTRT